MAPIRELRLVITVPDYDEARTFYRDVLGLSEREAYAAPNGGRVTILEAARATIELADSRQAEFIDEVEVGHRVAGKFRVAFEVDDAADTTERLVAGGADLIADTTRTPWESLNSRLRTPGDVQVTVFQEDRPDPAL